MKPAYESEQETGRYETLTRTDRRRGFRARWRRGRLCRGLSGLPPWGQGKTRVHDKTRNTRATRHMYYIYLRAQCQAWSWILGCACWPGDAQRLVVIGSDDRPRRRTFPANLSITALYTDACVTHVTGASVTRRVPHSGSPAFSSPPSQSCLVTRSPLPAMASMLDRLLAAEISDPTDFPDAAIAPGLRAFDDAVRCTICRDFYDAPVTLSCGHCYCSAVSKYLQSPMRNSGLTKCVSAYAQLSLNTKHVPHAGNPRRRCTYARTWPWRPLCRPGRTPGTHVS